MGYNGPPTEWQKANRPTGSTLVSSNGVRAAQDLMWLLTRKCDYCRRSIEPNHKGKTCNGCGAPVIRRRPDPNPRRNIRE